MAGKAGFDLLQALRQRELKPSGSAFEVELIDLAQIEPSKDNFYKIEDVEDLKASILLDGLQQNLVVRKEQGRDKYILISGERRYTALKSLVADGHEGFRHAPCKVEYDIDEVRAGIQLIFANSTSRVLSDYEKMEQATRLKEYLKTAKDSGVDLPGRMRDYVADALDISPTQVARLGLIDKNVVPELKQAFKDDKIGVSVAAELAALPEAEQQAALKDLRQSGKLEIRDVKRRKLNSHQTADTDEVEIIAGQMDIGDFGLAVESRNAGARVEQPAPAGKAVDVDVDVRDIVRDYLKRFKYEGLVCRRAGCSCTVNILMPCNAPEADCKAGYIHFCGRCAVKDNCVKYDKTVEVEPTTENCFKPK